MILIDHETSKYLHNNGMLMDIKHIISKEVSKKEWDAFKQKINYCSAILAVPAVLRWIESHSGSYVFLTPKTLSEIKLPKSS